ncbi:uncharacterized protein EKO05_0010463 [Ascochyta rabiei]|uniref:uncharacterized protein n=1 Tax=Didymella rabiei TaxID=5454 RepID=UPI00220B0B2C|nr:uncharacterized protein EKO05_0010463 [Ascochyta rabiei]UPX20223.1 hypothetical protein EKO05_0010463 [Ascochyta rabiei]
MTSEQEKKRKDAPPVSDDEVGIKVLREALEDALYPIDIVAAHGLGAHPDHTWTKTTTTNSVEEEINWLVTEPFLPLIAKEARIMRFGYKSAWFGKTAMDTSVRDIAGRLLKLLGRKRKVLYTLLLQHVTYKRDAEALRTFLIVLSYSLLIALEDLLS